MVIRTKIVATIGPASGSEGVLRQLIDAGVDVFRINFSHGTSEQREGFLRRIRRLEKELDTPVAILGDLCGPKIRVGPIRDGSMLLSEGQDLRIVREPVEGDPDRISTTLPELVDEVQPGETLLLNDGAIRMEVVEANPPTSMLCRVTRGGVLASGKGLNLPQTELSLSALTEKDRADAAWIAQRDFDFVALSFVRSAEDVQQLRRLLTEGGSEARIVAKIEKPQAVERIESILDAADAVMVARGDLGVEMDLPAVPAAQKRIVAMCQRVGKGCIVATQMLESMTQNAVPTRAEVSDVANAVMDRTDAVMLSGETAVGRHPVEAVEMMNRVVEAMQEFHDGEPCDRRVELPANKTVAGIARAIREIMAVEEIRGVAVFSQTGDTARIIAKSRPACSVLVLSPSVRTVRQMCLYYGTVGRVTEVPEHTRDLLAVAADHMVGHGLAQPGEKILVVSGRPIGKPGCTNTLVVHTIGQEQA